MTPDSLRVLINNRTDGAMTTVTVVAPAPKPDKRDIERRAASV